METLDGTWVTLDLLNQAKDVKRRGSRVFMVKPEVTDEDVTEIQKQYGHYCDNCHGSGQLILQYFVAGPFDNPPGGPHNTCQDTKDNPRIRTGMVIHNGQYYLGRMIGFRCPVCNKGVSA
jgi:hypothetical protein